MLSACLMWTQNQNQFDNLEKLLVSSFWLVANYADILELRIDNSKKKDGEPEMIDLVPRPCKGATRYLSWRSVMWREMHRLTFAR